MCIEEAYMNTALWIVQILLALVFLMAGTGKVSQPKEKLKERGMKFVEDFSGGTVKVIGSLEIAGALGVVLPSLFNVIPQLTPLAAGGLVLTMIGATLTHIRRGEYPIIIVNIVLLAMAAFVAYGRLTLVPLF